MHSCRLSQWKHPLSPMETIHLQAPFIHRISHFFQPTYCNSANKLWSRPPAGILDHEAQLQADQMTGIKCAVHYKEAACHQANCCKQFGNTALYIDYKGDIWQDISSQRITTMNAISIDLDKWHMLVKVWWICRYINNNSSCLQTAFPVDKNILYKAQHFIAINKSANSDITWA